MFDIFEDQSLFRASTANIANVIDDFAVDKAYCQSLFWVNIANGETARVRCSWYNNLSGQATCTHSTHCGLYVPQTIRQHCFRNGITWTNVNQDALHEQYICFLALPHDDVIKWKHFPRYWPFVRGIHRWIHHTKNSDAELWCFLWSAPWMNGWVNSREACDLRRHRTHYDVIVMQC